MNSEEMDAAVQGAVCAVFTWALFIGIIFYIEGCDMYKQTVPIKALIAEKEK